MLRFFERFCPSRKQMELYNVALVAVVFFDLWTNPKANAYESGFDIAVHAFTAMSLNEHCESVILKLGSTATNIMRLGSIYTGVTSGFTAVPIILNAADTINHSLNTVFLLSSINTDEVEEVHEKSSLVSLNQG
jgi:hypothetical protein